MVKVLTKEKQIINKTLEKKYEYGFTTDIESIRAPRGLNEGVIKFISKIKGKKIYHINARVGHNLKYWRKNKIRNIIFF